MSAEVDSFADLKGYTAWPVEVSEEEETSKIEYPEPEPVAGQVVRCPDKECSWVGAKAGWASHHRLTHVDR